MLHITLLIVAGVNLYYAYLLFFTPQVLTQLFAVPVVDNMHQFLTMLVGALLSVFGLGALLPLFRPLRYASIIIMLLLMHFMIFIIDVVVLARAQMDWQILAPQMVYFLIISTALVRWYPVKEKQSGVLQEDLVEQKDSENPKDSKESQ